MTRRPPETDGFTLIELVVAVAILAIGTVAAYRSFEQAQRGIGGQIPRLFAHEVAMNRAAELRLVGMEAGRALPHTVTFGNRTWTIDIAEAAAAGGLIEARILVTSSEGPGATLVAFVPRGAP